MKITEKKLLDGFCGQTVGFDWVSIIDGTRIIFAYRRGNDDGIGACVCSRDRADRITLENDRHGDIELDPACDNHAAVDNMSKIDAERCGDELPG